MLKRFAVGLLCLSFPLVALGQSYSIFTEDFESGLGSWTAKVYVPGSVNDDTPLVFDDAGSASNGTPIYGPNVDYPGTHSVGYSSSFTDGWDGNSPQWLQRQWQIAPDTYNVTLTFKRYAYWSKGPDADVYGVGNRVYVVTDTLYDRTDADMPFDQNPFPPEASLGDGLRQTRWVGADAYEDPPGSETWIWPHNGAWENATLEGQIESTSGNIELRLLMHQKDDGAQTVAWDDIHLVITPAGGGPAALDYTEDFENGYAGWTYLVWPHMAPPGANNDTPLTFTSTDPLLFANLNNPGSISAGYASNLAQYDWSSAYMERLFPAAVPGGETYDVRFEYDCYVCRNYDTFMSFPSPSGTGIHGPNTAYPGSQSVGVSYDPPAHDDTEYVWIQQLHPAAVPADPDVGTTYDVRLQADVYVYLENASGDYQSGSRILFLTDGEYNDPDGVDPNGDVAPGFRTDTWNQDSAGTWMHIDQTSQVTTTTGNIEVRLVADDKMQVAPGMFTIAWDNVIFTISEPGGGPVVYTISDDFESGYGNWTVGVRNSNRFGVGNRMYILTDDQYDDPTWDFDHGDVGGGMAMAYWPDLVDDQQDWSLNGVWRQHVVTQGQISTATGNIEVRLLHHDKNSGAQAVAWDNLSLTLTRVPPPCGDLRFDRDSDGDVDQADFAVMQVCFTGDGDPSGLFDSAGCNCFDTDNDLDVDQIDLQAFEDCVVAPGAQSDIKCDDMLPPPLP